MSVLQRRVGAEELQKRASELQRRVGAAEFRSSSAPSSPQRGDTQKAAARHRTPPPGIERAMSISRLTFSFDSSGWLYVYHLGVAHYLQRHVLVHKKKQRITFVRFVALADGRVCIWMKHKG